MGWRDLGCYGSEFYETPNIDRLAREGMLFTDAYAACPVCSPTRASIMSGKYPARVGVTNFINEMHAANPPRGRLIDAPYIDHLPLEETSLASALRAGGYRTWQVGKWHLGGPDFYPERHGFDVVCEVPISFPQAALGAEVQVPTLDGRVTVKVPPGTESGKVLRLRGKGIRHLGGRGQGDQLLRLHIETPERLTPKQRELLEAFEATLRADDGDVSSGHPKRKGFLDKLKELFD